MLSRKFNLFCPRIGKNASSTISSFFKKIDPNMIEEGHEAILDTGLYNFMYENHRTKIEKPIFFKNCFKFAFVRNPYDRFVSAWKEFGNSSSFSPLKEKAKLAGYDINKAIKDIEYFIDLTEKFNHVHWMSQSKMLKHNEKILVDKIYYFENLENDIKDICKKIGVNENYNIPHVRKSKRKKDFNFYLTKENKKKLYIRYEDDFKTFNYDPGF